MITDRDLYERPVYWDYATSHQHWPKHVTHIAHPCGHVQEHRLRRWIYRGTGWQHPNNHGMRERIAARDCDLCRPEADWNGYPIWSPLS